MSEVWVLKDTFQFMASFEDVKLGKSIFKGRVTYLYSILGATQELKWSVVQLNKILEQL